MRESSIFSRRFAAGALLVLLAGIIQSSGIAAVGGVRPNILLVLLLTLVFFFREWKSYAALIAIATIFSKTEIGFSSPYIVIAIISACVFLVKPHFPGHRFFNVILAVIAGTIITYVITDLKFLGNDPFTVMIEVVYNVLVGIVVYLLAERIIGNETEFRTSR
ncbi:MAG: hypothetical protein AAB518_01355 [Patescibacteria group bacterium]